MRAKELRAIVTFPTTTDAMAMENYSISHDVPGRLIPIPTAISAGCGMCWSAPSAVKAQVEQAAKNAKVRTEGIYELVI